MVQCTSESRLDHDLHFSAGKLVSEVAPEGDEFLQVTVAIVPVLEER